jgi:amino acid permease
VYVSVSLCVSVSVCVCQPSLLLQVSGTCDVLCRDHRPAVLHACVCYVSVWTDTQSMLSLIHALSASTQVLPMENVMKDRSKLDVVLYIGMAIVTLVYTSFGLIGYLVFGSSVEGTISQNMPDQPVFTTVKVCM